MYHPRQKLFLGSPSSVVLPELKVNEKGGVELKQIDQSKIVLPDSETTELRPLLDAGVDVKRVNTKLFNSSVFVTDLSVESEEKKTEGDE